MPLHDNGFSNDSESERFERLRAIQEHSASTIPFIEGIHADVSAWMQECHSVYESLVKTAQAHTTDSQTNGVERRIARKNLRQQLGIAKKQIAAGYAKDEVRRRSFDIESTLPYDMDKLMVYAEKIVGITAKHKSEGISYYISDFHIAHLQEAIADAKRTRKAESDISADESRAYAASDERFDDDSLMLQRLLGDWLSALGDDDPRISLIGMVNAQKGGNSGKPGAPSVVIDSHDLALVISPDPKRPAPTSYQTEFRKAGMDAEWEEFANGSDNRVPTAVELLHSGVEYEFRTRARNANGYGEWSAVILRVG